MEQCARAFEPARSVTRSKFRTSEGSFENSSSVVFWSVSALCLNVILRRNKGRTRSGDGDAQLPQSSNMMADHAPLLRFARQRNFAALEGLVCFQNLVDQHQHRVCDCNQGGCLLASRSGGDTPELIFPRTVLRAAAARAHSVNAPAATDCLRWCGCSCFCRADVVAFAVGNCVMSAPVSARILEALRS